MMSAAPPDNRVLPRAWRTRRTRRTDGPDPVDVRVGARLREARLFAHLSQEELGRGIGVSFQAVQKYEHGENRLSASRLYRAARVLDRPVAFFFATVEGDPLAHSPGESFSRAEVELVRYYRQLANDDIRHEFRQFAKVIGAATPSL